MAVLRAPLQPPPPPSLPRRLETKITKLCESPFINEAFIKADRQNQVDTLTRENRAQKLKLDHLQGTAQEHHRALVAMRKHVQKLAEEKDIAEACRH